jgi:hypothetical protein
MPTPFFVTAAYAGGVAYPASALTTITPALQQSGWNTIIFGLFHIGRTDPPTKDPQILGDIYFNDTLIISKGKYVGDPAWPAAVNNLVGGGIKKLLASFGGAAGWVYDFTTIQNIYEGNNNSFAGTNLEQNLKLFRQLFPSITTIDMDNEDNYNSIPSFVAFCEMLIGWQWTITFCPYTQNDFWTDSLVALEQKHPGAVVWWNLQCYDGGGGNSPDQWANYINTAFNGKFNVKGYIVASDWTRFWDPNYNSWRGDCPTPMQNMLSQFKGQVSVGGGFIWNIDQIYVFADSAKQHPGSGCDQTGGSQAAYVNAILKGLRG